nr:hypothetical protein [Tanacetum cinerariifolium]
MLRLSIKRSDSLVRASTTASLDDQQDNSNIAKTQSKATLNFPNPQGEGLGSGLKCQETMGVLDLEKDKTAQAKEIASLKKRVTKRHDLGKRNVSKQKRKNFKSEQKFQDINDLVDEGMCFDIDEDADKTEDFNLDADTEVIVEDKGSGEKEMKNQKAKEKGVAFKDTDDSDRPIRSITTLQPLPTIDPKDKGSEEDEKRVRSRKKRAADDDKAINYQTLDFKSPIVDCKSQVLGTMVAGDVHVYKLTRLDGSYRHFSTFFRMLKVLDRQDVLDLHKIVMERFLTNDPECYDLILWGYLKTLMESSKDDEIWRNQQDWKLLS